ncbi:MAG: DUF3604 domain-containing protein [Myxococcota bacterium]
MPRRLVRSGSLLPAFATFLIALCQLSCEAERSPALAAADGDASAPPAPVLTSVASPCENRNPERNLLWGELHVHTGFSGDAWRSDVRTRPADAYRFALGEAINIPPLDTNGRGTQRIQLERPLDFAAVTDHAETLGSVELCTNPENPAYATPGCDYYRRQAAHPGIKGDPSLPSRAEIDRMVCGENNERCVAASLTPWEETRAAAARYNDTSAACEFTTFLAYEWSGALGGPLLHRNIIFRNAFTPVPMGSNRAPRPWDLFRYLESECLEAGTGCDVLSIPHNSNTSQGEMFALDYPGATTPAEERAMAERRVALEPVIEIMQHKGDSECRSGLAGVFGDPDELCNFEKLFPKNLPECTPGVDMTANDVRCTSKSSFARTGLAIGLAEKERIGANPFEYGFIAATDTHNANPGDVTESSWQGHVGNRDALPQARMGEMAPGRGNALNNPGGIAAVWATENSREAIFDAIRNRETYGTSGPRIAVRFFGGWDYPEDLCETDHFVESGYAEGVPMGSSLPAPSPAPASGGANRSAAPVFALHTQADPGTAAHPGGLLQRAQIVKVWNDADGGTHQRIFDVAGNAQNGASVDPNTCEPQGPGARELCQVWRDPEFDAKTPAVYYARVVENPSCRWQASECLDLKGDDRPNTCDSALYPKVIQERAWTSPIWYKL